MKLNSYRPLFWMQILLLIMSLNCRAQENMGSTILPDSLSFRVTDINCLKVDPSRVGWKNGDQVCLHVVDERAPDVITQFVSVYTEGKTTNYFLANPDYTEFKMGSAIYPSITYHLIDLNKDRVGVGVIEFIFQTLRDMEEFNIYFMAGVLPTRKTFITEFSH